MTPPRETHPLAEVLGDTDRRRWLRGVGAAGLAAGALTLGSAAAVQAQRTQARIVVAGSGAGGLAVASRLRRQLEGATIIVVDRRQEHWYQPGWTLVGSGIWPKSAVVSSNARFMPRGVEWVQEMVAEFDPDANAVVTDGGRRIAYDFLVVATGLHLSYEQIEGMDVAAIGRNGLTSVYASPQAAHDTWRAMDGFRQRGGKAVMTLPSGPLKCAGAPLKMTFMLIDRLRQAGTLERTQVHFHTGLPDNTVFGVKAFNDQVLAMWDADGVQRHHLSRLAAIDIGARRATFVSPEGERQEVPYDYIHVVPSMRAPDAVKNSALAAREGPMAPGGWLEVDRHTLRHRRYGNVFGVGDINGTPRGKTAATVKAGAPLVVRHLSQVIAGQEPDLKFDGYTSCPLILREGSALLVEFDYEGRTVTTVPFVDPMQPSWLAWLMKVRMLKPAYFAMLRGRV